MRDVDRVSIVGDVSMPATSDRTGFWFNNPGIGIVGIDNAGWTSAVDTITFPESPSIERHSETLRILQRA